MSRITGELSQGHLESFTEENLQEDLQRGRTLDKSYEDGNEGGTSMAKGQKSREPVDHPLSRSQPHTVP